MLSFEIQLLNPPPKSISFCVSPLPGTTKVRPRKREHTKRAGFWKRGHPKKLVLGSKDTKKRPGFRKQGHPK